ncbi:chemotaxis regulatory protein ChePep-like [Euwallacea similis]|uniref:chemotaxis regulatory protein ChePep-like n=1 Tax=Euwallacea similis TaxID=1736056 RepID=UPI0034510809
MHIALSQVGILFLALQCHSHGASSPNSENNRHYPTEAQYQPIDKRNIKQERPLQPVSSAGAAKGQHETPQVQATQHELIYTIQDSNNPEAAGRTKRGKKLAKIEQYLKEVTPTTKTLYQPRQYQAESQLLPLYEQYIIETSKPTPIAQNILAIQNAILARENAIYEQKRSEQLQRQLNAKKGHAQNYDISEPEDEYVYYTNVQYGNEPAVGEEEDKEEEESDDDEEEEEPVRKPDPEYDEKRPAPVSKEEKSKTPNREIVYYHNVEYNRESGDKQSYEKKNGTPEDAPVAKNDEQEDDDEEPEKEDEEEEREEEEGEEEKEDEEPQKPPPPKFQAKLPEEIRQKVFLPTEAGLSHLYQPQDPYELPEDTEVPSKNPKERIYVSDVKYEKNIVYKPGQAPHEEVAYFIEPEIVEYQLESAPAANYITDEKKGRYSWQPSEKPTQQIQSTPKDNNYQKYRNNVVQYHQVPVTKATKPRQQVVAYVLVPHTQQPSTSQQSYQTQQYAIQDSPPQKQAQQQPDGPAYLGPTDEEYQQSQVKQKLGRNSSLRILKTGKPVVFIGHEE